MVLQSKALARTNRLTSVLVSVQHQDFCSLIPYRVLTISRAGWTRILYPVALGQCDLMLETRTRYAMPMSLCRCSINCFARSASISWSAWCGKSPHEPRYSTLFQPSFTVVSASVLPMARFQRRQSELYVDRFNRNANCNVSSFFLIWLLFSCMKIWCTRGCLPC